MKQLKKNLKASRELLAAIQNAVTVAQIESDPADLTKTIEATSANLQSLLNRWRDVEFSPAMRKVRVKKKGLRQTVKTVPFYVGRAGCLVGLGYFGEIDLATNWPTIESDLAKVAELITAIENELPTE